MTKYLCIPTEDDEALDALLDQEEVKALREKFQSARFETERKSGKRTWKPETKKHVRKDHVRISEVL